MAQVFASFPGVNNVVSANYTRTLGVTPNVASLRIVPQTSLPAINGNLTLGHGAQTVTLPACRVDMSSLQISTSGHIQRLRIFDRRVWWRYASIDGLYNVRDRDGSIRTATQKSAQQLAAILLGAMGESGYDVSALPVDDYPFVHWQCSQARFELANLCERYGCDVDLNVVNNLVRIVRLGTGVALPNNDDVQSVSFGADIAEAPGAVKVCGDYVRVQSKLKLFPMALDIDGSLKRLDDMTLSYAPVPGDPDGGFSTVVTDPGDILPGAAENVKQAANKSLYRYWLVVSQADGTQNVPGWMGTPHTEIDQILPLKTELVETYTDAEGIVQPKPAFLSGRFARDGLPNDFQNTTPCEELENEPFRISPEFGLVITSNPIVKYGDDEDEILPADLFLTTSYNVQDPDTFQYARYSRTLVISANPGVYAEQAAELDQTFQATYDTGSTDCATVQAVIDNTAEVDDSADVRLAQIASKFQSVQSFTVQYRSIQPINNDGARRSVTWKVSTIGGAITVAQFNNESSLGTLYRRERLRLLVADEQRDRIAADQVMLRRVRRKGLAL